MKSQFKLGVAGGSAGIARAQKLVEPIFVGSQGRAHAHYAPAINFLYVADDALLSIWTNQGWLPSTDPTTGTSGKRAQSSFSSGLSVYVLLDCFKDSTRIRSPSAIRFAIKVLSVFVVQLLVSKNSK